MIRVSVAAGTDSVNSGDRSVRYLEVMVLARIR
jgi:hypothetical protein